MVERSAFKVPFRLGGTIYDLSDREAKNPIAAMRDAELLRRKCVTFCWELKRQRRLRLMPDSRPSVKLDFTSGLDKLLTKPLADPAATTLASVAAGRQLGFSAWQNAPTEQKLDGRRLRSRGANTQLT